MITDVAELKCIAVLAVGAMDLIRFCGDEKLGILLTSRGKYATLTTNVCERVPRRSHSTGADERQEHEPGGTRSGYLG
jgi:hypothetical protein